MKAEPTDLACFLSGCGPGECNVHRRRSSQPVSPREKNTAKAIDQDVADKIENLGLTVMAVNQVSGVVHHPRSDSKETSQNVIRRRPNETETKQRDPVNASPILKSNPSSVYSLDTFPHAVQSQEVAAKGTSKEPLSSVVVTNFSLPGPKAKNNQTKDATETDQFDVSLPKASDSVRFKSPVVSLSRIVESGSASPSDASTGRVTDSAQTKSAASLKTKNYSPSLRSVSSKAASIRHALLKPPDTDVEPADIALPVPPVLTQVDVRSLDVPVTNGKILKETTVDGSANEDSEILTALNAAESAATEVVVHLTSLKKARDLADRIKNRSETTGTTVQYPPKASESTSQQVSKSDNKDKLAAEIASKSITSLKGLLCNSNSAQQPPGNFYGEDSSKPECYPAPANESHHNESGRDPGKSTCPPGLVSQPPQSIPLVNSVNAVYWGFVPTVKEAVQDAFQISVRKAVEEIIVPPGSRKDEAAEAYRKLVADSLTAAAKDADRYLRRASLLNEPPSIIRERSEDDPEFPESTTTGLEPLMGGAATDHPGLSSDSKPPETSQDNLDTVPLETVDERLVENHKQGWKVDGAWNGLAKKRSSGYAVIPTRSSSKSRFLGSKPQSTPESSVKESPKSFRKPRSKAIGGLRSISSVGSDDRLEADERDSTAQEIVDRKTHRSSVGKQSSAGKLGRRNTIHWLRELLSTNGPYEPRFTALPPRTRRDENASTGRIRSQTAPAVPIPGLYLGATPRPDQSKPGILNQRDTSKGDIVISMPENGDEQTTAMTKAFTKTISDLEFLLNEALFIARQAAEKEGRGYGPKLLGKAAAVLKGGRKVFEDDAVRRRTLKTRHQSRRQGQKRSDDVSSVPSMHESFGSFSSSDSEDINEVEDVEKSQSHSVPIPELRLKTPTVGILVSTELTQTTHRDAGWSPPGRVPTPFPPGSIAHSRLEAGEQSSRFESPAGESGGEDPDPELPCVRIKDVNPFLAENVGNWRKISQISPTKRSRSTTGCRSQQTASCALDDLALAHCNSRSPSGQLPMPAITPRGASLTKAGKRRATQTDPELINANFTTESVPSKQEVREYIRAFHHPPIQARESPLKVREQAEMEQTQAQDAGRAPTGNSYSWQNIYRRAREPCSQEEEIPDPAQIGTSARAVPDHDKATSISKSYDGSQSEAIHFDTGFAHRQHGGGDRVNGRGRRDSVELRDTPNPDLPQITNRGGKGSRVFDLKGRNHISLRGEHHKGFSFARTHKKPKIARDWAPARKRFVATVACISTALVGSLVGVYAAEVPAIQYWIVDFHHYTILGNVFFFIGLSIPTFFFWPLPLLHGRKPYTLGAMSLAMPLLFPQALAVGQVRSPYVDYWRVGLIFSRALMGFVLGFANMNFKATLLDLFGASLQSENPHQEVVDENDVRRHGGGLGVWLGIWTWCAMGSIGIGFLIGAIIINHGSPAWGFYISIAIIAFVLLLNVICPEVRRSAFRRSVAELRHEEGVSRRLGRGEVKMHMVHTGPKWWGEEFHYGVKMNAKMLRQPGFMVLALYVSWIYGQVVLLVVVSINADLSATANNL
jgi:MFS family permease